VPECFRTPRQNFITRPTSGGRDKHYFLRLHTQAWGVRANSADSRRLVAALSKFIYPFVSGGGGGCGSRREIAAEGGRSSKLNKSTSAPVCIIARPVRWSAVRGVRPPPPHVYVFRPHCARSLIRSRERESKSDLSDQASSQITRKIILLAAFV
jgi:hypothetical protein